MKRFILFFVIVVLFVIPLKSTFMTIGFHYQTGKTIVDKWDVIPPKSTSVEHWDADFHGFYIQLLFQLNKFSIGLEYGKSKFFYSQTTLPRVGTFHMFFREEYDLRRVLFVTQYELIKNFYLQAGVGMHFEEPKLGFMLSVRNHIRLANFLEIPVFIRGDMVSRRGTPIALSFGTGLVIRWKSGL